MEKKLNGLSIPANPSKQNKTKQDNKTSPHFCFSQNDLKVDLKLLLLSVPDFFSQETYIVKTWRKEKHIMIKSKEKYVFFR